MGLPGAKEGLQARDVTIARLLKAQGYMTAQFANRMLVNPDVSEFEHYLERYYPAIVKSGHNLYEHLSAK